MSGPRIVGTGKKVALTIKTSGIDSGEQATVTVYKVADGSTLDTIDSKVTDDLITAEWEAKGPGADDEEQGWEVFYKATCKELETKASKLWVYTDWVEVSSVDAEGNALPDACFKVTVGEEVRERNTGSSGVRKEEHLPPGKPVVEWLKPYRLLEWVDETGPTRKAKVEKVPPAKLVSPEKGQHKQWVNRAADPEHPEWGSKLEVKATLVGGKKGQKVYARLIPDEDGNSKRSEPKPGIEGAAVADWCPKGDGLAVELRDDDGKPDCEAVFQVELGLAGGDRFFFAVGGTEACDDEKVLITNWRQLYYQATKVSDQVLPAFTAMDQSLAKAFIVYEKYHTVDLPRDGGGLPAGAWLPGDEFDKPGKKVLVVGPQNRDAVYAKFDDQKTPIGAHLIFCDAYYDGGAPGKFHEETKKGVVKAAGPHQIKTADTKYTFFTKAVQDGNDSLLEGTWKSKAPEGHPHHGKTGAVDMAWIKPFPKKRGFELTLKGEAATLVGTGEVPEGKAATDAEVKHPVEVEVRLHRARGPLLGNSKGQHQLIVVKDSARLMSSIMVHELAHSLRQSAKAPPAGLTAAEHPFVYTGKGHNGSHCSNGLSDTDRAKASYRGLSADAVCVMFGEGGRDTTPTELCLHCLKFTKADDCKSLHPAGAELAEEESAEAGGDQTLELVSINGGGDAHFAPGVETAAIAYRIAGCAAEAVRLEVTSQAYGRGNPVFTRPLTDEEKADGEHTIEYDGTAAARSGALAGDGRRLTPLHSPYKVRIVKDDALVAEGELKVLYHSIRLGWGSHVPGAPPAEPADLTAAEEGRLRAPEKAERVRWVQWKLNQLGYDAGPVDGNARGATLQGALRRFQRASYEVGTTTLLAETGRADQKTIAALKAAPARERWERGKDPLREDCKHWVHDNYMTDRSSRNAWYDDSGQTEFNSGDRARHAEARMERAFLPLEVEVLLLGRDGQGHAAPDAVGPVGIAFALEDGPQDLNVVEVTVARQRIQARDGATQIDTMRWNPKARAYVDDAAKHGPNRTKNRRIDGNGDNCATTYGGWRHVDDQKKTHEKWFDTALAPFEKARCKKIKRGADDVDAAIVRCWDDPARHPARRGRAGAYVRMSTKGGDDAKLKVWLTFDGLANKDALVAAHQPREAQLTKETGRWTTWRRTRVSAFCQQVAPPANDGRRLNVVHWDPAPPPNPADPLPPPPAPGPGAFARGGAANQPDWGNIAAGWRHAFLEVEGGGAPAQVLGYAGLVTEDVYKRALADTPSQWRPAGVRPVYRQDPDPTDPRGRRKIRVLDRVEGVTYRPRSIYGGAPLPAQGNTEGAVDYVRRIQRLLEAWADNACGPILKVLRDKARETSPEGFVLFDFSLYDEPLAPLTIKSPNPRDYDAAVTAIAAGNPPAIRAAIQYTFEFRSYRGWVVADGAVLTNVHNPSNIDNYVIHECGHARFLWHHKTESDASSANWNRSDNQTHHDGKQDRCAMSYTRPNGLNLPGDSNVETEYPFCGKCLLKLRGWTVTALPTYT